MRGALAGFTLIVAASAYPQAQPRATSRVTLEVLISETLRRGPDNQLPAHLAEVLGLSHGGRTLAVKQAVRRDGTTVHIFNVCLDKKNSVVLINVNEATDLSRAYLISSKAVLNKAVSYNTGAPPASRSVKEARADLDRELAVWTGS